MPVPKIVVRRGRDRAVVPFAGVSFDGFHQGARISIGARRSLAIVIGDARPAIMRPHGHEIRDADPVETGHIGNFCDTDDVKHGARAVDRDARPDGTFYTTAAVF